MNAQVVRPNKWDSREVRLESALNRILHQLRIHHPDYFEADPTRLDILDMKVAVRLAESELKQPRHADLDSRVRSPVVRWWRDRRV